MAALRLIGLMFITLVPIFQATSAQVATRPSPALATQFSTSDTSRLYNLLSEDLARMTNRITSVVNKVCSGQAFAFTFRDCSHIKYINPSSPSGVYTIQPPGQTPFNVYCDMSESIGWTKILQIRDLYDVSRGSFGDIRTTSNFSEAAKLNDSNINAIRQALQGM